MKLVKYISPLFFLILVSLNAYAQGDLVGDALFKLKDNDLRQAKVYIDSASLDTNHRKTSRLWYVRGYIYKDLYKQERTHADSAQLYRMEALQAFRTTLDLDSEEEYRDNVTKIMRFLASTLYNDAATALDRMDHATAIQYYDIYKDVTIQTDPNFDFTNRDIQFKLVLASVFNKLFEDSFITPDGDTILTGDTLLFRKVKDLYEDVLSKDSLNVSASYNLGILYYNQAVQIIEQMDVTVELTKLFEIQERCIDLFQEALPHMKKAYRLNPTRRETLIGLSGIYFSLNDLEKSEFFKDELKLLDESRKGGTNPGSNNGAAPGSNPPTPENNPKQD